MNIALLTKWLWKFKDPTYTSLWKTIIIHLYYGTNTHPLSPFWYDIMQLEILGSNSITYAPGSSSGVCFWHDIWFEHCALSSRYPQLYSICITKDILLAEVINSQGQNVLFSDVLTGLCLQEWNYLLLKLSKILFTHEFDKLSWRWEQHGHFSVKSLYQVLNFRA